jgi:predicted RND superfamily exporter protein
LEWTKQHFPQEDRVMISWDDSSLYDPRLTALQDKLKGIAAPGENKTGKSLPEIDTVISPQDVFDRMLEGGVDQHTALDRLTGVLVGRGPLRVRLSQDAKSRQSEILEEFLRRGREELALEFEILAPSEVIRETPAEIVEPDAPEENTRTLLADLGKPAAHDFAVQWPHMHTKRKPEQAVIDLLKSLGSPESPDVEEVFFQPGTPAALGVAISYAGRRRMSRTIETLIQSAEEVGIPRDQLRLGGRPICGNELNQGVKKAFWNRDYPIYNLPKRSPLLFSAFVGVILAFIMLRSARLAILVLVAANYTVLLTVALVPLTMGSMNMVLVCMPSLLSVLTLSAAIHVANYWKHAALEDPKHAIANACRMARQPCALASITTAVGLMSLTTSSLTPVRDFGLYAAVGCLISLVIVLYGLPAMLQFWPGPVPKQTESDHRRWERIAHWLTDHWKPVASVSILAFLGCSLGLIHFRTETKIIRYFPDDKRVVQDYDFLEENLSGIVPVDVLVRFDHDSQQRLNFAERRDVIAKISEKIRQHPEISGTMSLADFVEFEPAVTPTETDKPQTTMQKMASHRKLYEAERQIKSGEIAGAKALLAVVNEPRDLEKMGGQWFSVEAGDELWRITAQVAIMSDLNYADLTGDWTDPVDQPGELNTIVESVLAETPGTTHLITGMVPLFLQTQQAVLNSLILSFCVAFILIALIMMYLLKHPVSGLLTMIPNVLPVGMVFGLISWGGISVDIGTMITASVALGIAVDGTLHLLSWFRKGILDGLSRRDSISRAMVHCGPALWQTSMAVGIGLLMLYPAELLLVSRFGWLMAALIAAALLADLIVLPALLAGPLGPILERTIAKSEQRKAPVLAPAPVRPIPNPELAPQHGHWA